MDWASFRPLLEAAWARPAQGPGGPRPNDPLKLFKALLVQRCDNLSAAQTEYQSNARLSFQQFIGGTLADRLPDANTLWDFREALVQAEACAPTLRAGRRAIAPARLAGTAPASLVAVPRQKASHRQQSKLRARIEHGLGFRSQSMKGF